MGRTCPRILVSVGGQPETRKGRVARATFRQENLRPIAQCHDFDRASAALEEAGEIGSRAKANRFPDT